MLSTRSRWNPSRQRRGSPERDGSVLKAADELAAAVRARDLDALLLLVAPDAVPCVDGMVSRQELKNELRATGTWLGAYFFAPEVFSKSSQARSGRRRSQSFSPLRTRTVSTATRIRRVPRRIRDCPPWNDETRREGSGSTG